jgi:drug/metabolite transporter (DMT)-like permease
VAPEVSIVYRYAIASLLLFAWCRLKGLRLRFDWRAHGLFFLLGLSLFSFNHITGYRSQIYVPSAVTAVMFSSIVWLNIINARIFFGTRSEPRVLAGAGLGIAGIVVLFAPQIGELSLSDGVFFGSILALIGALSASLGNMVSQRTQKGSLPVMQANAWAMFYGASITTAVVVLAGIEFTLDRSFSYLASLGYLAVFGSIVAYGAYLELVGRIGAHRAGYVTVVYPMVALVLSVLFEGLEVTASLLFGMGLILVGNVFVLGSRRPRAVLDLAGEPKAVLAVVARHRARSES